VAGARRCYGALRKGQRRVCSSRTERLGREENVPSARWALEHWAGPGRPFGSTCRGPRTPCDAQIPGRDKPKAARRVLCLGRQSGVIGPPRGRRRTGALFAQDLRGTSRGQTAPMGTLSRRADPIRVRAHPPSSVTQRPPGTRRRACRAGKRVSNVSCRARSDLRSLTLVAPTDPTSTLPKIRQDPQSSYPDPVGSRLRALRQPTSSATSEPSHAVSRTPRTV
jgi:hypothetical protein